MTQRGIVRELNGNKAVIAVGGDEGCSACGARESCMSITGKKPEARTVTVENALNAQVGDAVELELPVSATMQVIGLTFLLPVVLLIAGYWIMMPSGSAPGAIGAVSGLAVGMVLSLALNRKLGKTGKYRMTMTAIVEKNCTETEVTE